MAQSFVYNFTHATDTGAVQISTGPTLLASVVMNTPGSTGNIVSLHNGTSTSAAQVAVITVFSVVSTSTAIAALTLQPYQLTYDVMCPNGLFFNNTGGTSPDMTVIWS